MRIQFMQAQSATGPVEIGEASPLIDDDAGDDRLGTTLTGDVPAPRAMSTTLRSR